MKDETIYHIYAKNVCLYPCLKEEEFKVKWAELKGMVGLMKTDYIEASRSRGITESQIIFRHALPVVRLCQLLLNSGQI